MLLEAMIAMLIFALGVLGVVSLQAVSVKQAADAQYRSTAAVLANNLIGTMWATATSVADLQTRFASCSTGTCTGFTAWRDGDVIPSLPGVVVGTPTEPQVAVGADGTVTITVRWSQPADDSATIPFHQYVAIAQIRRN
jgi:type IV pilus assembly protein PilV